MPKRKEFTEKTLLPLLEARMDIIAQEMKALSKFTREKIVRDSMQPPLPRVVEVRAQRSVATMLTRRLLREKGDGNLFSNMEFEHLASEIMKLGGEKNPDPQEIEVMAKVMKTILTKLDGLPELSCTSYTSLWKWIETAISIAEKRRVSPLAFLKSADASDEITRALVSKQKYLKYHRAAACKASSYRKLKESIFAGFADQLARETPKRRAEIKADFEKEMGPELRKDLREWTAATLKFYEKEAQRIFSIS